MVSYTLEDAQEHLSELLEEAAEGETVVILDKNNRAVQLVPMTMTLKPQPRKAGSARGQIVIADNFDAPLDDFTC